MSFGRIAQAVATASPSALTALILLAIVVFVGAVVCLRIALRDTSESARPEIIRALADFFKSLWGRK